MPAQSLVSRVKNRSEAKLANMRWSGGMITLGEIPSLDNFQTAILWISQIVRMVLQELVNLPVLIRRYASLVELRLSPFLSHSDASGLFISSLTLNSSKLEPPNVSGEYT